MKETKFIELLNLYVDHQISDGDAALLEAEIQQNPQRREVYRQYCRMQKACVMLADNFRSEAPEPAETGKIVAFAPPRHSLARALYVTGTLAAAACVAAVVVLSRHPAANGSLAQTGGAHLAAVTPVKAAVAPVSRPELQPVFVAAPRAEAVLAEGNSLDWITRVQLSRMTPDQLKQQTQPVRLQHADLKLRQISPDDQDTSALSVALRFQK